MVSPASRCTAFATRERRSPSNKASTPGIVQERLGHSTIAITLGIYSHVSPTLHDEAANAIAGLLLSP